MQQNKLYVGNLSYNTTSEGLNDAFSGFGDIDEVKLITDFETGRSRGFAFITFQDAESAEKALELNDTKLDGRHIKVNIARDKRDKNQHAHQR